LEEVPLPEKELAAEFVEETKTGFEKLIKAPAPEMRTKATTYIENFARSALLVFNSSLLREKVGPPQR